VKGQSLEQYRWVISAMDRLARHTYQNGAWLAAGQYLNMGDEPLDGGDSAITALIVVEDTEAQPQDTIYGKLEFLQLVGITKPELLALKQAPERVSELVEKLKAINPDLVTDMSRRESLIE
jgi:hypothetical protein